MEEFVKITMNNGHEYEISKYLYHDPETLLPCINISWVDAIDICLKMTEKRKDGYLYRLPTEEEWEYAATGGDERVYPWGNEFDKDKCNALESNIKHTTPIDKYHNGVSPFGCYDMIGNVWEWCQNWYDSYEWHKIRRGGAWNNYLVYVRCTDRISGNLGTRDCDTGFRLVRIKIN